MIDQKLTQLSDTESQSGESLNRASSHSSAQSSGTASERSAPRVTPAKPTASPAADRSSRPLAPWKQPPMKFSHGQSKPPQPTAEPATFLDRLELLLVAALRRRKPIDELLPSATVQPVARAVAEAVAGLGKASGEKARTLMEAFKDPLNDELRGKVRDGAIEPAELVRMDEIDLMNPVAREEHTAEQKRRDVGRNAQAVLAEAAARSDLYPCPDCGKRNVSLVQQEKAKPWFSGGDDTSAVMCTCLECGTAFRP